jgi:secreted trypsin-like serine protease
MMCNWAEFLQGDSGGPVIIQDTDGKYTQIGIVSFGSALSCNNYPNGYTRVASYLGWISAETGLTTEK